MKEYLIFLLGLILTSLPVVGQQSDSQSLTPAWVQDFNRLSKETRRTYIQQFQQSEQLFAQKRIMECLFSLMELEKIHDKNPGLYNLRGACYIEIRNIEKALANFEKAQELDPTNITIQFNLAEAHYVNHDYAIALKAFTDLLNLFKGKSNIIPLLQFKRYICACKLEDHNLIKQLESCYGPLDDSPYYYCVQAVRNFMKKDKEAAQEQLLSAIRIYKGTSMLQTFTDAMSEAGIIPSPYGQTVPTEHPTKTGFEKHR